MWSVAPPEEKVAVAHRMALIHFERATRLAASGNFKAAAIEQRTSFINFVEHHRSVDRGDD
jgi:hypothetical protein